MAQNNEVAVAVRRYTRVDYIALQATLHKIPISTVIQLYYNEEDLEERGCRTDEDLREFLVDMRDHLAQRATRANPAVAGTLADARARDRWAPSVISYLVGNQDKDNSRPQLDDAVSAWFKPTVRAVLGTANLRTLRQFKAFIEGCGPSWHRAIPRIGAGKARAFERWFAQHAATLGPLTLAEPQPLSDLVVVEPGAGRFVPLERMAGIVATLDGSQGRNRNAAFSLIAARNDLEAVQAYLYRYREREKTRRSYQKELERFLLWCVLERGLPMSGILTDDCEAYKDFLKNPAPHWCGVRRPRGSTQWRPFVGKLDPRSARFAVQVLRAFFTWLVNVRYLGGNPWVTVSDPAVAKREAPIDINKALPSRTWAALSDEGGILDRVCESAQYPPSVSLAGLPARHAEVQRLQYRLARAAILLMGTSGLRREEAATATRDRAYTNDSLRAKKLWALSVLGKGMKWRTVVFPQRAADAIADHWADRGLDFASDVSDAALLSPVVVPPTATARRKHLERTGSLKDGAGYSADGLYQVVKTALRRMAQDETLDISPEERKLLEEAAPHALRHTYATEAVADRVDLDIIKAQLGHASLDTTSIYVQTELERRIEQLGRHFRKKA